MKYYKYNKDHIHYVITYNEQNQEIIIHDLMKRDRAIRILKDTNVSFEEYFSYYPEIEEISKPEAILEMI